MCPAVMMRAMRTSAEQGCACRARKHPQSQGVPPVGPWACNKPTRPLISLGAGYTPPVRLGVPGPGCAEPRPALPLPSSPFLLPMAPAARECSYFLLAARIVPRSPGRMSSPGRGRWGWPPRWVSSCSRFACRVGSCARSRAAAVSVANAREAQAATCPWPCRGGGGGAAGGAL